MTYQLKCSKCNFTRNVCYSNYQIYRDKKNTCKECYIKSIRVDIPVHNQKFPAKCPDCKVIFLKSYKHINFAKGKPIRCFQCSRFKKGQTNSGGFKKGVVPWNKGMGDASHWQRIKTSKEWKEMRREVFERDKYTCQICGIRGGELHPDHIKPKAAFPELTFELSNIRTLCKSCHKKTDTYGYKAKIIKNNTKLQ